MVKITKIKLHSLLDFIQSEQYLSFTDKPISLIRAKSYVENPNANKEDVVLYMAFFNKQLVGYRTILSDVFYSKNSKQKFGWLSGNWVHPKHRRKNISTILLNEVLKDWNKQLMYSNYAEASKAVYDKINLFAELTNLNGVRYYRRWSLADLLPPKNRFFKYLKPLLSLTDWIFNLKFKPNYTQLIHQNNIQIIKHWDKEIQLFLSPFKKVELFKRNIETYQWIKNNPWIKTEEETKQESKKYYFSSYAKIFKSDFYVIKNSTNKIIAVLNISIKNKQLKIPYFYSLEEGVSLSKDFIVTLCSKYGINYVTIYDEMLNKIFIKEAFIKKKPFSQKYFITKDIAKNYPDLNTFSIQTGDGDSVFT